MAEIKKKRKVEDDSEQLPMIQSPLAILTEPRKTGVVLHTSLPVAEAPQWRLGQNPRELRKMLNAHGIVIVPDILTEEEADTFKEGITEHLSLCNKNWQINTAPGTTGHGLMKHFVVAMSVPCQKVRCLNNVQRVFSDLLGLPVADLVTSIDSCAVVAKTQVLSKKGKDGNPVLAGSTLPVHVDVAKDTPGDLLYSQLRDNAEVQFKSCVQASVVAIDQVRGQDVVLKDFFKILYIPYPAIYLHTYPPYDY